MKMAGGQFRCAFFAQDYESTLVFYRDELELPVIESWDRGRNDRGTLFRAASGVVEILAFPQEKEEGSPWDYRNPSGVWMVIEVEHVEELYRRALERNLPLKEALKTQVWGHRSFIVSDPNGLAIYFFSPVE
jgi:uncharacterized glyoxalase superfamily protein PhnB